MKNRILMTIGFVTVVIVAACSNNTQPTTYDCTGVTPTYTTVVKQLMDGNCALSGCHNAATHERGIDLSSYSGVKAASTGNNFMGSMQHLSAYESMPKGGAKLADEQLKQISCWIKNGNPQ